MNSPYVIVIARVKILKKTVIKRKENELFVINLGLPKFLKKELGKVETLKKISIFCSQTCFDRVM